MPQVTVSSKGQIAVPKLVRDALNLAAGSKLDLEVRGREIVLTKKEDWKKLHGAAGRKDLLRRFAAEKRKERELEDARP